VPFIFWDTREKDAPEGRECGEAVSLINIYRTLADMSGLEAPAMTTWGRGNYTLRSEDWRYTHYFDGSEELYSHADDPDEWVNEIDNPEYSAIKEKLAAYLPEAEAPLVKEGISLWNIIDADKPSLEKTRSQWKSVNKVLIPPLGD